MWQRLFDAMIYCTTKGVQWDTVYNWNVDEFADVYQSLQRIEARDRLVTFSIISQAFGGDKKSVKSFIDNLSVWLPQLERGGGVKKVDDFVELVQKGLKLKK